MEFHTFINDEEQTEDAVEQLVDSACEAGENIDAVFVFLTEHHLSEADWIIEKLWLELDPQCLIGCSAEGVIGEGREIERTPGISLLVGTMPGVRLHPFRIGGASAWREVIEDADALRERIGIGDETGAVIALGDPFSTPLDPFLSALDAAAPGVPLVGGMASSARSAGHNRLARNDEVFTEGLVGLSLSGPIEVQTVVSQGCRPIGRPMIVTRSRDNVIEQLGGRPATQALLDMVNELSPGEQQLLQKGLLIGRAVSEYREHFRRGDFLVRNVLAVDEQSSCIAVADHVRTGQTVQFHLRDAATADEDLGLMLANQRATPAACGGLLFSCNGRGTRLFNHPGHDISLAGKIMPATPLAGFFAAGEFGMVGGKNFIHGHTASFALFRGKST